MGDVNTLHGGILDHPFILHIIIHFIWSIDLGLFDFIHDPLEQLNFAIATVGAATELALHEQIVHPPARIAFIQLDGQKTFNLIVDHIHNFNDTQTIIFNHTKSYITRIRRSQQLSTSVLEL